MIGIGDQITGQLMNRELVEGPIGIETGNHPVTIRPDIAGIVGVVADRVGKADDVEPANRHAFAVMRTGQQLLNHLCEGVGCMVLLKGCNRSRDRGQPGEVEGQSPNERAAVGRRAR